MPRSALPQNYAVQDGILFEDFESLAPWPKISGNGNIEANTSQFRTGTQSMKMSVTTPGSFLLTRKTFPPLLDLSSVNKLMHFWFYLHTNPTTTIHHISATFYNYFEGVPSRYFSLNWWPEKIRSGWNHAVIHRDDWALTGNPAPDWNSIYVFEFKVIAAAGQTASVSFDEVRHSMEQLPRCVIAFDDACETVYTEGYAYMHPRGVRGTIYVAPALIGTAGYCTLAHLEEMYSNGWALANHSYTHPGFPYYLTGLTRSQIESELSRCSQWLNDHGFTRAAHHLAYPGGYFNDDVFAALDSTGMYTGRSTLRFLQTVPVDNYKILGSQTLDNTLSLAAAKSLWIDAALKRQSSAFLHGHILDAVAGPNTWAIADFRALIDYITACGIKCVTIDEWYNGLTNPRYRSLSLNKG
ncbi:MAG: polysaccharide deacetylase family protein [bacterium]